MKTPIYVLTLKTYDYYEFTDLIFASCDLDEVIEKYKSECNEKFPLYYNEDLTEQEKYEFRKSEHVHYLITTFKL